MASADIKSIGLFIDGNDFKLIDKGLKAEGRRVNIKGLIKYIQKSIAEKYELESSACVVTEAHFFRGRYKAYDAKKLNLLLDDRKFEDRLIETISCSTISMCMTCRTVLRMRKALMSGLRWRPLRWLCTAVLISWS